VPHVVRVLRLVAQRVAVLLAAAALATAWWLVVAQLRDAAPVSSPARPSAIVWGDRVFTSKGALASWLRAHGVDYGRWSSTHPAALRIVDLKSYREQRRAEVRRANAKKARNGGTAAVGSEERSAAARSGAPEGGGSMHLPSIAFLLVLLATLLCTLAALPYRALAARPGIPRWALAAADYRFYLVAIAAAISLGVATGSVVQ
jgi:hypothetical protein